jgi:hypothetical protein
MFYCDACAKKYQWPTWMSKSSRGRCEMCGRVKDCYDVPSRALPVADAAEDAREGPG